MTGNDDLGTMSAWYVFSSLGLYPVMNGSNQLAVSSPQFPSAVVKIGSYAGRQGGTLRITAPNASDANRYVQSARLGRTSLTRTYVNWSEVAKGGTLAFTLGTSPSRWGTGANDAPPSVNRSIGDLRTHVDAAVLPNKVVVPAGAAAQQVQLGVDVVAQSPLAVLTSVRTTAPAGWQATAKPALPALQVSRQLPVSRSVAITVKTAPNTPIGTYPITVAVRGLGANTVTLQVSVEVRAAATCASEAAGQCAVELGPERDADGTATVEQSAQGNFDGFGWSFDAALLPPAGPVTFDGVTYAAPDPTGTAANFVTAKGQSLLLPTGQHAALRLIASAFNGPVTTVLNVAYADGTNAQLPLTVADWCGSPAPGSVAVVSLPHRIRAGMGVDGPPISLYGFNLPLDAQKEVRSVSLPDDARLKLYAVTLT
jgi:hypothetical protein